MIAAAAAAAAVALAAAPHGALPPPAGARYDDQIGGAYAPARGVAIVERDRTAPPARGRYGICYVNAFQTQPGELAWWRRRHHGLLLIRRGREVVDRAWGETLLDTSTRARRRAIAAIVGRWIDGCARSGYDAVEPDNLDSWTRSRGALTRSGNLALALLLVRRAHADGLAVAQKNAAEIGGRGRALGFDFAIAEECQAFHECGAYTRAYGRHVIEIEYPDDGGLANFRAACRARGRLVSIVLRDRDVLPRGARGHVERWCPAVSSSSRPA